MLNNDLSNTPSPAVYVVWEGLIATCGEMRKVRALIKLRRFAKALDMFETHTRAVDAMWQSLQRGQFGMSVLTHLPAPMAALLPDRLDRELVPCRDFLSISPVELVSRLPHMPYVAAIADPELYRARAYGSLGRYVPPEHAEVLGNLR